VRILLPQSPIRYAQDPLLPHMIPQRLRKYARLLRPHLHQTLPNSCVAQLRGHENRYYLAVRDGARGYYPVAKSYRQGLRKLKWSTIASGAVNNALWTKLPTSTSRLAQCTNTGSKAASCTTTVALKLSCTPPAKDATRTICTRVRACSYNAQTAETRDTIG
jgi:hypothetical protein